MNVVARNGIAAALILGCVAAPHTAAAQQLPAEQSVRQTITRWNAAYRAMDPKRLATLFTDSVEIIDRFGHWVRPGGRSEVEQLWHLTFTQIYKGRPGPERVVESVRMLTPNVALVQATTQWDKVTLDDGTVIPAHGEIDTFVLVRQGDEWRIASLNIHNRMAPGTERPGERVPTRNP